MSTYLHPWTFKKNQMLTSWRESYQLQSLSYLCKWCLACFKDALFSDCS